MRDRRRPMHLIREPDGRIPVIGTNEAARTDAFARVQTYLAAKLSN